MQVTELEGNPQATGELDTVEELLIGFAFLGRLAFCDSVHRLRNGLAEQSLLFQPFMATTRLSKVSSEENVPGPGIRSVWPAKMAKSILHRSPKLSSSIYVRKFHKYVWTSV